MDTTPLAATHDAVHAIPGPAPVVPKLDIAGSVAVIQSFAETPEMSTVIAAGNEHAVTFRSEALTIREIPCTSKVAPSKSNGSSTERTAENAKMKLVLTPRSKVKLSDAFRNYQKSSFPSIKNLSAPKSAIVITAETTQNQANELGSSEFRKMNAALSKEGRRKIQTSKMHSSEAVISDSERVGFTTDFRDLSLRTKRFLEVMDHMKSKDALRTEDDRRRLAYAKNEKNKCAISGEDVEKFFHKATTLACVSDSVYVRRDAAQAVATLMVSSLPSDVLMSQPESLSGMLDLFESDKIDASVKLKVLNSFAAIVEDDRYKQLTLQQHALFQRFLDLDHKRSKSFANGKAQVLSAMACTLDISLKDEFQLQGGFNEMCRMIEDARDVQVIENLIPGLECLLCDPHDAKLLHWTTTCIQDIVKICSCDFPRVRITALNGIVNCCKSIHSKVQQQMSGIRDLSSHYHKLLSNLDPIDVRTINPEGIGEYMFRLKAIKSLLAVSSDPVSTMREMLPLLLKFIQTSPESLQHDVTLAAKKYITADSMFEDNLTIEVAFARLIRNGTLVICPKYCKGSSHLEKSGSNLRRATVAVIDSDQSKGRKGTASENQTPRNFDAPPNLMNRAKAEEVSESEQICSHILAQALDILSQIFSHDNDELRKMFVNPESQFSYHLETLAISSSSSRIHKAAGNLLCDFGRYALSDTSPQTSSPFSEPRFLQTLCALIAAQDLSLCENVLNFLLFHAAQIRATRESMRCIGIADLLRSLGQRSGSLRILAYSAILLTHLSITEDIHSSDVASMWIKELHAVATLMGSKMKEAESLQSFQTMLNFLCKEKVLIGLHPVFKSSLKVILPWMRQITLEDVSTGFDKQRRRICNDIISVIKMDFIAIANHSRATKWLARVRASMKRREQVQREKDDPKFIHHEIAALHSK